MNRLPCRLWSRSFFENLEYARHVGGHRRLELEVLAAQRMNKTEPM
jgi:hypothetical protein